MLCHGSRNDHSLPTQTGSGLILADQSILLEVGHIKVPNPICMLTLVITLLRLLIVHWAVHSQSCCSRLISLTPVIGNRTINGSVKPSPLYLQLGRLVVHRIQQLRA